MSLEDFKNFTKGNGWKKVAMIATIVSAHQAHAMADNNKNNDRKDAKVETIIPVVDKEDNIAEKNLAGVAKLELVRTDDGDIVPIINDKVIVNGLEPLKELKKEYKEEQKEAFADAVSDNVEEISVNEFVENHALGNYSTTFKNITQYTVDTEDYDFNPSKVEQVFSTLNEEDRKKAEKALELIMDINDEKSIRNQLTAVHEEQHRINDKNNIYAPGISAEQYGKLNYWNEISAKVTELALLDHLYKKQIKQGVSQEDAIKIFDKNKEFVFYKNALQNGMKPDSKEAKKLMVQGTISMWRDNYEALYQEQTKNTISYNLAYGNVASVLIGNDKDYQKRVEKIFDSIDENPQLKEKGVKIGNLSQYLPEKDIELSSDIKAYAAYETKKFTSLTPEQGQEISEKLPGSQKKDIKNLIKILTGRKTDPNIPIVKNLPQKSQSNSLANKTRAMNNQER